MLGMLYSATTLHSPSTHTHTITQYQITPSRHIRSLGTRAGVKRKEARHGVVQLQPTHQRALGGVGGGAAGEPVADGKDAAVPATQRQGDAALGRHDLWRRRWRWRLGVGLGLGLGWGLGLGLGP